MGAGAARAGRGARSSGSACAGRKSGVGPQHALLCVKQAKAYLDDVLAMGWDGACLRIRRHDLEKWFGHKAGFCNAAQTGAGIESIRAFLGGAFAKGHGVRDALAILNRTGKEKPLPPRRCRQGLARRDGSCWIPVATIGHENRRHNQNYPWLPPFAGASAGFPQLSLHPFARFT